MINKDNIYELLSHGERVTLECKKAQRSVPNSLWETYSAFANTYGGTILLGVVEHMDKQDKSKRFEIIGVEDADKIRKDLWNIIRPIGQKFYEDKNLSRERLCANTGLSDATAKREIAYLKRVGVLKRIGSDKNGYWVVKKSEGEA